jgi:hypothetical protein
MTADSKDKMMAVPKALFKGLRKRPTFQNASANGTSMRANERITTAAQATNNKSQICTAAGARFTLAALK